MKDLKLIYQPAALCRMLLTENSSRDTSLTSLLIDRIIVGILFLLV
jgi:hypothetical protein